MKICKYAVLAACFFFSGCIWAMTSTKDVTDDSRYWGEYKPELKLMLIEDVYINKKYQMLLPENYYNNYMSQDIPFAWPRNFAQYKQAPDKYPELKILKKGLIVKCLKIFFLETMNTSIIDIFGIVLDDCCKENEVSLRSLSIGANYSPEHGVHCLKPNPSYLKPVEKSADN